MDRSQTYLVYFALQAGNVLVDSKIAYVSSILVSRNLHAQVRAQDVFFKREVVVEVEESPQYFQMSKIHMSGGEGWFKIDSAAQNFLFTPTRFRLHLAHRWSQVLGL